MGLFSKLKANFNHGGVKVHVQAPSSVPANQVIPVTVSITADSSQSVKSVKVEIKAVAREQGVNIGLGSGIGTGSGGNPQDTATSQVVAKAENREPFTIAPGETKQVTLELFISGMGNMNMGNFDQAGALGGALQAITSIAQNFSHMNFTYTVHASADVEGIALDPSDKQPIQILPPAETAAAAPPESIVAAAPAPVQPQTTVAQPQATVVQPQPIVTPVQPEAEQPTNDRV